jgi:hypothetical protein
LDIVQRFGEGKQYKQKHVDEGIWKIMWWETDGREYICEWLLAVVIGECECAERRGIDRSSKREHRIIEMKEFSCRGRKR